MLESGTSDEGQAVNPGVREVFCRTLLEHRLDLVAVQELADPEALYLLVAELNSPTLPAVVRWPAELRVSGIAQWIARPTDGSSGPVNMVLWYGIIV